MNDRARQIADKIVNAANDGYLKREDYPPYAVAPWDDRRRWSEYIRRVAAEVLEREL